jgi:hypothetical protein
MYHCKPFHALNDPFVITDSRPHQKVHQLGKKEDEDIVNTCINNDGYGRKCRNKRLAYSLYCGSCWNDSRGFGL